MNSEMKAEISALEVSDGVSLQLTVRVPAVFRFRVWLGLQIMKVAAWVLPIATDVVIEDAPR